MASVESLTARLEANPGDHEAYEALKSLYWDEGDFGSLAALVAGWAEVVNDDLKASVAYAEVGDILSQQMGDHEQGKAFYAEALARNPLNFAAAESLEALWEATGEFDQRRTFLEQRLVTLAQLDAPAQQLAVMRFDLGELCRTRFDRPAKALLEYRRALELDPGLLVAMYESRQLYLAQNDLRAAAELYELEAVAEPDQSRKVALYCELSGLYREGLRDIDGAISALQRACALAPGDSDLGYELVTLLLERAENADEHTRRADHAAAADLLLRVAVTVAPAQAIGFLESALGCVPTHEAALAELERLLGGTPDAHRLAGHWVAYLAAAPVGQASNRRRVLLARAYADQGQLEDAIFCLEPAAAAGDASAVKMLGSLQPQSTHNISTKPPPADTSRIEYKTVPPTAMPKHAVVRRSASVEVPPAQMLVTFEEFTTVDGFKDPPLADNRRHDEDTAQPLPTAPPVEELADAHTLRRTAAALAREQRHAEAAEAFHRLLQLDPLDREGFAFLDGHYRRTQQHAPRAELFASTAALPELPDRMRESRLREAASIYEARLKDFGAALACLNTLQTLLPEADDVLRSRKRLLERIERWDELAELLEREIAAVADAEPKLPMLRRLAQLHRERRNDRASAADVLERMLALRPDDKATRDALLVDLLALGRNEEAALLIETKIDEATVKAPKLTLLHQLAALIRDHLRDADRAYAVYERILELAPTDADAFAQMQRLDETLGNHERLLSTLARKLATVRGAEAAALLARMAGIADESLGDRPRATDLLAKAVELAPENQQYFHTLCELYERDGRYDEIVELLRESLLIEKSPDALVEILRRLAHMLSERLGDAAGARDAWEQLLKYREDREALLALRDAAAAIDDADRLARLLGRLAAIATDPHEQRDLLFEQAALYRTRLGRPAEALPHLLRILLKLDPEFEPAFDELCEVADLVSDYRGLCDVLQLRVSVAKQAQLRVAYARRLADLCESKLKDSDRAITALGLWAEAEPDAAEPLRRLEALLSRAQRYPELLINLDALTRVAETPQAQQRAAIAAADVAYAMLADIDGAWARLSPLVEQGVEAAIEATIALAQSARRMPALYDLLERAGQIKKLLAILRGRVEKERDPKQHAGLLRRTAQLLIDYEEDEDEAATTYRALLAIEEDSEALLFLQALAVRRDDPETLVEILMRLAALEKAPAERHALLFEHAQLLTARLTRPDDAIPVLQGILAENPNHEAALSELMHAAEQARDFVTLATALSRVLEKPLDDTSRVDVAARLADVCEHELRDIPRAISALQAWTELAQDDTAPHRRLRSLLGAAGRGRELLATLDALARIEPERALRVEATIAAAELASTRLADPEAAWQRLVPLLSDADAAVDVQLRALATQLKRLDALYDLLEAAGRHATLVALLRERVTAERAASVRAALIRRLARTLTGALDDDDGAAEAWSALLEIEEDAEALQFLRMRALRTRDMERVGDCLRRLSAIETDPGEKRDLLYEYGRLLHTHLGRAAQAVTILRGVVEQLDPDFEPALDELVEACTKSGDDLTLAVALDRMLAREQDDERRVDLAQRLADLCEHKLGDRDRAIVALQAWVRAADADLEPRRRLIALLAASGRHQEQLAQLDALAERTFVESERAAAIIAAAELAVEQLRDADGAWSRLLPLSNRGEQRAEALLARIAFQTERTVELAALYEAAGRFDDLVAILREQAERTTDEGARAELFLRCARLFLGPLSDELAAAEAFREVLRSTESLEALKFLRRECTRLDEPAELADILQRIAKHTNHPTERRDLLFERALLLADRLDEPEQASALLRMIVTELDPTYGPAIEELIALCEGRDDYVGLAVGLERQLVLARGQKARGELAERLADLYEDTLDDKPSAIAALFVLHDTQPRTAGPLRRLRTHLQSSGSLQELLGVLDALTDHEDSTEARAEAALAAAALASGALADIEGAWERLTPWMLAGDAAGETAMRALATTHNLGRPLANLYLLRAQQPRTPTEAARDWMQAARIYEQDLGEPREALEAALRALALDMNNRELLGEIDRMAVATSSWDRLARVYGKLIEQANERDTKAELLLRHAELLERGAADPAAALECVLKVCKLVPDRDDLLKRAERLAIEAGSQGELVVIYEKLSANAASDEQRVRHLLRAARAADLGLKDREHALRNLSRALRWTETSPVVAGEIVDLARELDRARPELGVSDARRALIRAHMELAQAHLGTFGPLLVLRASQLWRDELGDDAACFDALKQGATLFPDNLDLYDALERAALKIKRLDALDAHLARAIPRATDPLAIRALLQRRGKLLGEHLGRHAKAAEVYRELLVLDPNDSAAFEALLSSYKLAGRFQDLLKAYDEGIARTAEPSAKLELMRRMATVWETDLKNRASALEVWERVRALAPDDAQAAAALVRSST